MRLLLVFLKEPIAGQVKTRLASAVGEQAAAQYYQAIVEVLLKQLHGLRQTRIRFCYAPKDAGDAIKFWILPAMDAVPADDKNLFLAPNSANKNSSDQEVDFRAQGPGHLGERLCRAFDTGFQDGFEEVAAMGSDCPDCGARWINLAFARLSAATDRDGVIGPGSQGDYYFLALKSQQPELFEQIPWKSAEVFNSTINAAQSHQLSLSQLPELSDINDDSDWQRLMESPLAAATKRALGEELPTA